MDRAQQEGRRMRHRVDDRQVHTLIFNAFTQNGVSIVSTSASFGRGTTG
jgi:hypothetical protein